MKKFSFYGMIFVDFIVEILNIGVEGMSEIISENWISIEEAAEYLGVKTVTVRNWIKKESGIPAHRIGKLWKFKRAELDEWVKSGKSAI